MNIFRRSNKTLRKRLDTNSISPVRPLMTETLFLAACTLIGYLSTYLYYQGVAEFYAIPTDVIEIEITSVVQIAIMIFLIVIFVVVTVNLLYPTIESMHNIFKSIIYKLLLLNMLLYLPLSLIFGRQYESIFRSCAIFNAFMIVSYLFVMIIETRKISGIKNKLTAFEINRDKTFIDYILKEIGTVGLLLGIIACISLSLSYKIGYDHCKRKMDYYVLRTKPELAVVMMFGDKIICVKYDKKTQRFAKDYSIIPFGSNAEVNLEFKKIGPLAL